MIVQCKPIMDVLGLIKVMSADSVTIVPTEKGWEFYVRDPSNCMMVSALVVKEVLGEDYDPDQAPFAVELDFFMDALAKREEVELTVDDGYIQITSGKSKAKRRLYTVDETPRIFPKIQLRNTVAILSDNLQKAAANKHMMGANECTTGLQVAMTETEMTISFESEKEAYSETYDVIMADLPGGNQVSHFTPEYLLSVFKVLPKGIPTIFAMDSDMPVKMSLQTQSGRTDIFIAPRIGE